VLRNKAFLIGLGSGLIAGAVMLQLMWKVDELENKKPQAGASVPTQEQVKLDAERLNLKLYTQQQVDEMKMKAAEEEKNRIAKTAAPVPTATPTPTALPKEKIIRTVLIPDRLDATSVAGLLVQAQIIAEPTKLISMLEDQKLTGKIHYGFYSFENSPDVTDVLKRITTLP
jgi:hypothetical protein